MVWLNILTRIGIITLIHLQVASMTYAMKPMQALSTMKPMQALSTLKVLGVGETVKMDAMTVHESAKGSEWMNDAAFYGQYHMSTVQKSVLGTLVSDRKACPNSARCVSLRWQPWTNIVSFLKKNWSIDACSYSYRLNLSRCVWSDGAVTLS